VNPYRPVVSSARPSRRCLRVRPRPTPPWST